MLIAAAHIGFEYLNGGVKSHHLLNNPDLPAISNWFGLVVLPLLGGAVALRARTIASAGCWAGLPVSMWVAALPAAVALPIYRVEFAFGFVLGMTFTVGSVLPLLVAAVFDLFSLCVRSLGRLLVGLVKKRAANP